jgi:hypothetical protein
MAPELKNLLQSAAHEIRDLRRQRDLLQAKVDGFEMASQFLNAQIRQTSQGMSIDVAWELDRACEESHASLPT